MALSCRNTGRKFGMYYNFLKILLNFLKPKAAQSGEIIQMMRSINQQSHAFTRELQSNLLDNKKTLEEILPGLKDDLLKQEKKKEKIIDKKGNKYNKKII